MTAVVLTAWLVYLSTWLWFTLVDVARVSRARLR